MSLVDRIDERFDEIGKVEIPDLTAISGVLENISRAGCKVHFNFSIMVDLDEDYELHIYFANAAKTKDFTLVGHPKWVREENGRTEIGFEILPSRDFSHLGEYISLLNENVESDDLLGEIDNSSCKLI